MKTWYLVASLGESGVVMKISHQPAISRGAAAEKLKTSKAWLALRHFFSFFANGENRKWLFRNDIWHLFWRKHGCENAAWRNRQLAAALISAARL
jgi:hypothetical protein